MNGPNKHAAIKLPRAVVMGCIFVSMATMAPAQAPSGWSLVWSDEFNQADGTLPDPAKWNYDVGGWGWGNNEIQYYTERPQNARVLSGMLLIEARRETYGGRNHTSARLLTKGKHQWTYGRFEARIRVPRGAGLWPAFWMLGGAIDQVGWPACGEIDIMEHVGRLPREVFGTVHGPGYSAGNSIGRYHALDADVADEFHTYVVEWEPGEIRWFVDDTHYFTVNPSSLNGNSWVFDRPHFLLLNLAIDGNFAGPLDPSVEFPQQMWVDYVRVYQREPNAPGSLLNGGFELGNASHWNGYAAGGANDAGIYVESTASTYYNGGMPGGDPVETRSGTFVGKIYGDFSGNENYNGCYQDISVAPNSEWQADGWVMSHPQDLMSQQNQAWIEVTFRDAEDRVLSLYRSKVMTPQELVPGQWQRLSVNTQINPQSYLIMGDVPTLLAPDNTSKLRYQLVFRQPNNDNGSMYFDDLSLRRTDVASDPTSPSGGVQITRGDLVNWQADDAEALYQIEKWTDVSGWQPLSPELFGKLTTGWFSPDTNGNYRVIRTRNTVRDVLEASATQGVQITWQTEASSDYQLQKSSDLSNWQDHGPAWSGDGGNATIPDSLESKVFYRVQQTGWR